MLAPMLTIGKLDALADVRTDTLRYYEREQLLAPASKSDSGYRLYDSNSVRRVGFIKRAQHCGFTLAEIAQLLALRLQASACCGDVRKLAEEKKLQLEDRIVIGTGLAGAVLSLLCCVTPVLALLLSAIGLTAFIAKLDYVLVPAFVASFALAIFALVRRRRGCPA